MVTDPITDMFVRIKNAQAVNKNTVSLPYSKLKQEIAEVLKRERFIADFTKKGRGTQKHLEILLAYKDGRPIISDFKRRSTPGQRYYLGWREIFPLKSGYGVGVVSTSKGLKSSREARKAKLGGEFLVEVW